jgi:hypothetical protein
MSVDQQSIAKSWVGMLKARQAALVKAWACYSGACPVSAGSEAEEDALWFAVNQGIGEAPSLLRCRTQSHNSAVESD